MRRTCFLLMILLVAPVLTARAAPAAPHLLAGAAVVDITPPPFDAQADAAAFPTCPGFTGPRLFALQEPYDDLDGSGFFNYPEPFCDANLNTRYDGLYLSGAVDHLARRVHDPIDARAFAVSDGTATVVVVSVTSQGLFENYTRRMRAAAKVKAPRITDLLISSNHNESSPDSVGIYGAPSADVAGGRSGIDEYYMDFLVDRVSTAAAQAVTAMVPATLHATQVRLPSTISVNLSKNFPTTDDAGNAAATNPKVGVLQARDGTGDALFTTLSLAAHNQQVGHSDALSYDISGDWPGYFHHALEGRDDIGVPVFLVGDNGSIEDPVTVPKVSGHPECSDGCYAQTQATGEALGRLVAASVPRLSALRPGSVRLRRTEFDVPLENTVFRAAAAGGLFGQRQTYTAGVAAGGAGTDLRTSVAVVDLGPDLQLLANPGESFPALTVGSHWGIEDAGCPERANPPVPTWHARARFRFQVGLADDLIGYLIPAWGFSTAPGVYPTTCFNDADDKDPKGHQHKLETESVGYTASNTVAEKLTALLDADPDPGATVKVGRWVRKDGSVSRRPEGAVGAVLADGRVFALPEVFAFATHGSADDAARFIDFDGTAQSQPDLTTHGVDPVDSPRIYLDVYPAMAAPDLGAAVYDQGPVPEEPTDDVPPGLAATGAPSVALSVAAALALAALCLRRRWQHRGGARPSGVPATWA